MVGVRQDGFADDPSPPRSKIEPFVAEFPPGPDRGLFDTPGEDDEPADAGVQNPFPRD